MSDDESLIRIFDFLTTTNRFKASPRSMGQLEINNPILLLVLLLPETGA